MRAVALSACCALRVMLRTGGAGRAVCRAERRRLAARPEVLGREDFGRGHAGGPTPSPSPFTFTRFSCSVGLYAGRSHAGLVNARLERGNGCFARARGCLSRSLSRSLSGLSIGVGARIRIIRVFAVWCPRAQAAHTRPLLGHRTLAVWGSGAPCCFASSRFLHCFASRPANAVGEACACTLA